MKVVDISLMRKAASKRKPGYIDAVMSAAVNVTQTHLELNDEDFERIRQEYTPPNRSPPKKLPPNNTAGPGTELKKLLAKIGIHASPTCKCNKMARQMDEWGPDESLKHIEEIVDVMEETAKKRKLPFLRTAGRSLVRIACWKARRR